MISNNSLPYHFLLLILFFTFSSFSFAVTYPAFNGYQIRELFATSISRFNVEAAPWTAVGLVGSSKTSTCDAPILGGYSVLSSGGQFQRIYSSLPAHNAIYFSVRFWIIDNWQTGVDDVQLNFDNKNISIGNAMYYSWRFPSNACGNTQNDLSWATMIGTLGHTGSTLTFKAISQILRAPNAASFGIRSVSLMFANVSGTVSDSSCWHFNDSTQISSSGQYGECKCMKGQYLGTWTSTCHNCDSSCADCFGSSSSQCYVCNAGYSFNGAQCIKCDSSCSTCSGPNANQCTTCISGYWLRSDNTCTSTCSLPAALQQVYGDFKVCGSLCSSSQFLLYDNTCVNSCDVPLQQGTSGTQKTCNKPCPTGKFYYEWNGTCGSECASPLIQDTVSNVDICKLACNGYLYPNNSCQSSCSSPYVIVTSGGQNLCNYPCDFSAGEFYGWNKSCWTSCNSPYTQRIDGVFRYCDLVNAADKSAVDTALSAIDTTGVATSAGVVAFGIASSSSPSALSLTSLVKMLQYIRYMKIDYPPKLLYLLQNQNKKSSISLNFGPEVPESVKEQFPDHHLPENFEEYNLKSSFFVNYSETLPTMLIILAIIFCSSFLSSMTRKHKKVSFIFTKIRNITRWDFFLLILCSNFDGIAFFSTLELRTLHLDSGLAVLSFLLCLVLNGVGFFVLARLVYIVTSIRKAKYRTIHPLERKKTLGALKKKSETCGILFKNFKDQTFSQQAYMVFFLGRLYLFDLIIGLLFEHPLAQAILLVTMSTIMILYLLIRRPFREVSNLLEYIINETILLIVNVNVLIMAIFDIQGTASTASRKTSGDVIIYANITFNILALVFMGVEIIIGCYKAYKIIKKHKKGKNIWMKIALVFFERDGMEVEDREEEGEEEENEKDKKCELSGTEMKKYKLKSNLKVEISNSFFSNRSSNSPLIFPHSPAKEPLSGSALSERPDFHNESLSHISPGISTRTRRLSYASRLLIHNQAKEDKIDSPSLLDLQKTPDSSPQNQLRSENKDFEFPPTLIGTHNHLNAPSSIFRNSIQLIRPNRLRRPSDCETNAGDVEGEPKTLLGTTIKALVSGEKNAVRNSLVENLEFVHEKEVRTYSQNPRRSLADVFLRRDTGRKTTIKIIPDISEIKEETI